MIFATDFEQQEAFQYRPGQKVELKHQPGVMDVIESYDPMMVPPIMLVSDPHPRYPEELRLIPAPVVQMDWLSAPVRRKPSYPACSLRDRSALSPRTRSLQKAFS